MSTSWTTKRAEDQVTTARMVPVFRSSSHHWERPFGRQESILKGNSEILIFKNVKSPSFKIKKSHKQDWIHRVTVGRQGSP